MKLTVPLAFLFLALSPWVTSTAHSQDSAALYFYGTPPTVEEIAKLAGDATVSSNLVESVTRVTVNWADLTVIIHIDPDSRRDELLTSIRQMLAELPAHEQHKPAVRKFLANLDRTTVSWGSLIDPGYDREGKVAAFLKKLVASSGGYLFTYQSFYSADGKRIAGVDDDPGTL